MQKIGISVLENCIEKHITNNELDFLLYIAQYQNEYGVALGIYYKDVCEALGISYQGFYNCKKGLEDKEIIFCEKRNYFDWDITILNNNFKGKENYGRGYVSLHCNMVRDERFQDLRAGVKLLGLLLMREWKINLKKSKSKTYKILKTTFNDKKDLFGISGRVLREYLSDLLPFFENLYLQDGRKYYITFKDTAVGMDTGTTTENDELRLHEVKISCRRNRIKEVDSSDKKDLSGILLQYDKLIKQQLFFNFSEIVKESLEVINSAIKNVYKWKRIINVPLVHKILRKQLIQA